MNLPFYTTRVLLSSCHSNETATRWARRIEEDGSVKKSIIELETWRIKQKEIDLNLLCMIFRNEKLWELQKTQIITVRLVIMFSLFLLLVETKHLIGSRWSFWLKGFLFCTMGNSDTYIYDSIKFSSSFNRCYSCSYFSCFEVAWGLLFLNIFYVNLMSSNSCLRDCQKILIHYHQRNFDIFSNTSGAIQHP